MLNTGVLQENAWEMVKDVRKEEYYNKSELCDQIDLFNSKFSFPKDQIASNFDSIESLADAKVSYEIKNISRETLDLAGEMFVFLNFCPSPLVSYYHHIILQKSSTEMLIALTQQKNTAFSPTSQDIADILYKKLESLFGFENIKPNKLIEWKEKVSSLEGKLNFLLPQTRPQEVISSFFIGSNVVKNLLIFLPQTSKLLF